MKFLPIVERELIEASRRRNTYWMRVGVAATGLAIGTWMMAFPEFRTPSRMGAALFMPLAIIALLYCGFIGVFRTADCLSEEKREGTLGLLFLTDLRGYDIVLGKLAATSLNALYGLMAIVPVLAIPLLAGGVSFAEFGRVVAVCVNTLFFSLAVGLLSSAVSRDERRAMVLAWGLIVIFVIGLPMLGSLAERLARQTNPWWEAAFWVPCPLFAAVHAFEGVQRGTRFAAYFWPSVGAVFLLSVFFLGLASWIVPRTWQDRPLSEAAQQRRRRVNEFGAPPVAVRVAQRRRLLAINPMLWLVTRGRFKLASVWIFLALGVVIWSIGLMVSPRDWQDDGVYIFSAIVVHTVLKFWVVTEACRRFSLDRQSGALELLLSTPMPAADLVRGQAMGITRQFAGPIVVVLVSDLIFCAAGKSNRGWPEVWVAGMAVLVADVIALTWLGMWRGLNSRRPVRAAAATLSRILVLPWLLWGLGLTVFGLMGGFRLSPRFIEEFGFQLLYLGLSLGVDLAFAWPARHWLLTRFRQVATERFETRSGRG